MSLTKQEEQQLQQSFYGSESTGQTEGKPGDSLLANVLGTVGSVGGGIAGAFVPGLGETGISEIAGASAGGALGQGVGQAISNLLAGRSAFQGIGGALGEGAAFGAIPGVSEGKLGAKLLAPFGESALSRIAGKTALRGVAGAGLGATGQAFSNIQQGQPMGENVLPAGLQTGALNAALPGLGSIVGKGIGMSALGKGGENLAALNKATGKPLTGSVQNISENIYNWSAPIRHQMASLLDEANVNLKPEQQITVGDLKKSLEETARQANVGGLSQKGDVKQFVEEQKNAIDMYLQDHMQRPEGSGLGSASSIVEEYGDGLGGFNLSGGTLQGKQSLMGKYVKEGQVGSYVPKTTEGAVPIGGGKYVTGRETGKTKFLPPGRVSEKAKTATGRKGTPIIEAKSQRKFEERAKSAQPGDETKIPLSFAQFIATKLDQDVGNKWERMMQGKYTGFEERINSGASAKIKDMIGSRLEQAHPGGKNTYKKLRGMLQTTHQIKSHVGQKQHKTLSALTKYGPVGAETAMGFLLGHIPGAAIAGLGGLATQDTRTALPMANVLQSDTGAKIMSALSRLGASIPIMSNPDQTQ